MELRDSKTLLGMNGAEEHRDWEISLENIGNGNNSRNDRGGEHQFIRDGFGYLMSVPNTS